MANICAICKRPSRGRFCVRCLEAINPEASLRSADTKHEEAVERDAQEYERAREADEADSFPRRRGPS